jgi:hypothetical protein
VKCVECGADLHPFPDRELLALCGECLVIALGYQPGPDEGEEGEVDNGESQTCPRDDAGRPGDRP